MLLFVSRRCVVVWLWRQGERASICRTILVFDRIDHGDTSRRDATGTYQGKGCAAIQYCCSQGESLALMCVCVSVCVHRSQCWWTDGSIKRSDCGRWVLLCGVVWWQSTLWSLHLDDADEAENLLAQNKTNPSLLLTSHPCSSCCCYCYCSGMNALLCCCCR